MVFKSQRSKMLEMERLKSKAKGGFKTNNTKLNERINKTKIKEDFETKLSKDIIDKLKTIKKSNNFDLQSFMDDMAKVRVETADLKRTGGKNYEEFSITNFLLWCILQELK